MKFLNNFTGIQSNVSPNLLHQLKPILIILLMCGYNFKFYRCGYISRLLIILYCLCVASAVLYGTMNCCTNLEMSQIWSLIEYVSSALAILVCKSNIKRYLKKLREIDLHLRINTRHYYQLKMLTFLCIIVISSFRLVYTWTYCHAYLCYDNLSLFLLNQFSLFALDMNRVWRLVLFETIRRRLQILRLRLEDNQDGNFYLYVIDTKMIKERKIKFCLHMYKSLADAAEYIAPELFTLMFISIVCSLPKLIYNTYHILLIIEYEEPISALLFKAMHICQICLFLFSPCISVEFYSVEVENIRRILAEKLLTETNDNNRQELQMFLQYTEMIRFKYKIWRIIPLNLQLPFEILNICTTYVIVVINFTHLY